MSSKHYFPQVTESTIEEFVVAPEIMDTPETPIHHAVRSILTEIGEDPQREGLQKTPDRVARMYQEITSGYQVDPVKLINGALFDVDYRDMVLVKDIEFYSMCEHHMLPFFGKAHVAYLPDGKVLGLSKIPRIVEMFARRLQVQERLTSQIADFLDEVIHPRGVAVIVEGQHMCAMMRGVKKSETSMVTRAMRGEFECDPALRAEFTALVSKSRGGE
jgi:GTP cyclohydrolase I